MATLMKGHRWLERKDKLRRDKSPVVAYPLYAEIKYDEIRCDVQVHLTSWNAQRVEFLSYAGKPLANMEQFSGQFLTLACATGYMRFDCGFLVNSDFNSSYRWVRSTNGLPDDLMDAKVSFILFDLPECDLPYEVRRKIRDEVARTGNLDVPAWSLCNNEEEVEITFTSVRELGLEGLMLKSASGLYEPGKRTDAWLKYKPIEDADGIVVGFEEAVCGKDQPELGLAKGDLLGRIGSVELAMADGSRVAPSGIPHALGAELLAHPENYLGKTVEFNFMERDRQGGYRHPTFKRFREETV